MTPAPDPASTLGELSTLAAQLDELTKRVTALAESYADTPDSRVAADLFAVERALHGARRSLHRAAQLLEP